MKKVSAILITLTLLLSITNQSRAYANSDANIKLDQAIDIAKEIISVTLDGYDFSSSYKNLPNGKNAWILEWRQKKDSQAFVKVNIDSNTGDILSMKQWSPLDSSDAKVLSSTKDQAQKIALDYLKKVMKGRLGEVAFYEDAQGEIGPNDTNVYCFKFIRLLNNTPFPENGVIILINKNTLKVSSYDYYWNSKKFLNIDEAKKVLTDKNSLELTYTLKFDSKSQKYTPILVYVLKNDDASIDAETGELINTRCSIPMLNFLSNDFKTPSSSSSQSKLEDLWFSENVHKFINKEQVVDKLKNYVPISEIYNPDNPEISSLQFNNSDNTATWFLSWKYLDKTNNSYGFIGAQVDALSSQIKSFSVYGSEYDMQKESRSRYNKEKALEKATNFLKKIEPEKYTQIEYRDCDNFIEKTSVGYKFTYFAKINGISAPFNNLNVFVNAYTGEIVQYSINWRDVEVPSPENIMPIDEAYEVLYNKLGYSLKYIKHMDQSNPNNYIIRPVYNLDSAFTMMDATTGDLLEYDGNTLMLKD
jgi:hypothetical protein